MLISPSKTDEDDDFEADEIEPVRPTVQAEEAVSLEDQLAQLRVQEVGLDSTNVIMREQIRCKKRDLKILIRKKQR
jgi:hypothetical protein